MPKIYITRRLPPAATTLLAQVGQVEAWDQAEVVVPRAQLLAAIGDAEGLLCLLTERIDEELLESAPQLRVVSNMAVGFDNIDVAACRKRGIVVCNTPGVLTEATADLTFALLLAVARRLREAEHCLRSGQWASWSPFFMAGMEVSGATLGIIGLGAIGTAVARRARGFGMRLLYCNRRRRVKLEGELGIEPVSLEALLRESDFVSVHVPLSEETHHLLGERELLMMKPTACLINTARGAIVDEQALCRVLQSNHLFGAGLDVYAQEPLAQDSPLRELKNVVLLPHIGSATVATRTTMAMLAARNLALVLSGKPPLHEVR